MIDAYTFLPQHADPIDWDHHDAAQACARLKDSARVASHRRLSEGAEHFMPPPDLVNAINAAIASRSPLLLTGEPGTGKTQVAYYLARYFGIELFHYQVHSDSSARDLRYDFDAVAYLRDAYLTSLNLTQRRAAHRAAPDRTDRRYLHKGKLWLAYEHPGECVLLIDEIDKAPRDFPNDLLQELADYRFEHPFPPGAPIDRGNQPPPIVIVTSNGERRLPDPFLRRCIVYHIDLTPDLLGRILGAWQGEFADRLPPPVQGQALQRFLEVRERLERRAGRPPGAAEFLIWLTVLAAAGATGEQLAAPGLADLPALHCLIKDHEDYGHLA
ncbi:MoxR family ATPase [uncultured Thiodictyon sp.]|uniref:AAA family ATPase n=1 Tax=uncultured Thiodictyon sp. TaxID=1846217 RepID=UPI0025E0DDC3|nr:MoxR family ATPase [uncultured Thiodictyon sp.]